MPLARVGLALARISEQCNDWLIVIVKLINVFADVEKRREESLSIMQHQTGHVSHMQIVNHILNDVRNKKEKIEHGIKKFLIDE